jgi:protein TonB
MRLFFACLISLGAHLAVLFFPAWFAFTPASHTAINATLRHAPAVPVTMADTVTSNDSGNRPRPSRATAPKNLSGTSLHRARATLSKHLFYPPPAVSQGLEGEVVLLLTLDTAGRILAIEIAKSSGHALLDEAAIDAARHLGALPGNPRQTLLPVSFRLQ